MSNLNFDENRISATPIILFCDYINIQFTNYLKVNFKEITPRDFTYLVNIFYHGGVSQRDLSRLLFVSEANVAQIIKRLEKNGLIYREISDENKSKKVVNLTSEGENIVFSVLSKIFEWENNFEDNYSTEEFKSFKNILYDYADKSSYCD